MGDDQKHPTEALQDAIDGRLSPDERAALEQHLATCAACRRELEALRWTKARLGESARSVEVPDDLDARVRGVLDGEDRRRFPSRSALRYGIAAAAAGVFLIWLASRFLSPALPAQAAADFRAFASGALPLDTRTTDLRTLESRLQRANLPFPARVFDFGMMSYSLVGGGVHRFGDRRSALFAYRSADGRAVVCQMFEGDIGDLPPPAERRRNNDIEFLVYRDEGLTIVFWQEGAVMCVLVADGDPEAAVQLAFAKAVRV